MVHTTRDNYKQKWLAATNKLETRNVESVLSTGKALATAFNATIDTNLELVNLKNKLASTVDVARDVVDVLDDCNNAGQVSFGKVGSEIDLQLRDMTATTMLSRIRDILRISKVRIGLLTAAYDELYEKCLALESDRDALQISSARLLESNLEAFKIGYNKKEGDIEDFLEAERKKEPYNRHKIVYSNIDDDDVLDLICDMTNPGKHKIGNLTVRTKAPATKLTKRNGADDSSLF